MKIKKSLFKLSFIIFFIFYLFGCTANNNYKLAHSFYKKKNWYIAVNFYDKYIKDYKNRAEATLAELERSNCYYNLGLTAYKKKNYPLAEKFFFLANSEQADSLLDNCYFYYAKTAYQNNDIENTLKNYEVILKYFPESELIPEILYDEIKIYTLLNQKDKAYEKYDFLCHNYSKNKFVRKAEIIIDGFMPEFFNHIEKLIANKQYNEALEELFYREKNPSKYKNKIRSKIAEIYIKLGEQSIKNEKYVKAKAFFEKAKDWNPALKENVNQRLLNIVSLFIKKGDELLKKEKLDEAITNYQPIFDIIPDYKEAKEKIQLAKKLKADFLKADSLYKIAKNLEEKKKYNKALAIYKKSYKLHKRKNVYEDIKHMENILRANKEPKIFAKEIVENYRNGIIIKNLNNLEKSLRILYKNDMKTSGWQIYYSFGKYKFEVRYDITTPDKTYYFIWRVNLEFQTISPLNKISKEYMGVLK